MEILILIAKKTIDTTQQEKIYYYHTDHLGTPIMLTDSNQAIAWDATYDPFGKATVTTASVTNNLRFPGQYYDAETGLHYNWHRYYWPEVGRYVQPDPALQPFKINTITSVTIVDYNESDIFQRFEWFVPMVTNEPQRMQHYVYVRNRPTLFIDFHGIQLGGSGATIGPAPSVGGGTTGGSGTCPCGEWRRKHWDRVFNIWCRCYWLCVPQGGVIWGGNPYTLPATNGIMIHTGKGGLKSGDDCQCKNPDGKIPFTY